MSTKAQIAANQINAERSTGPNTESGKAASSRNSWKHGLTFGVFRVLETESQPQYEILQNELIAEHKPATATEAILVERMAQHHWLRNRAVHLQNRCIDSNVSQFSLMLRYETMHERAFHKCLSDLLKLRAERQKQEVGFVSQIHKTELHRIAVRSREAAADYRQMRVSLMQNGASRQERRRETGVTHENQEREAQKAA